MRRADDAPRQEQIAHVAAEQAAVGNLIHPPRVPLVAAGPLAVNAVRGMKVNGPAAVRDRVVEDPLLHDILLSQHVRPLEAPALALARDQPHPLQRQVRGIGELARVLDVVPDPVNDLPEFPLDRLGVVHGVAPAAPFDPPEIAALGGGIEPLVARDVRRDVVEGVARRREPHRPPGVLRVEVDRVPEQLAVILRRGELLAELRFGLRAHAKRRARQKRDDSVARGVAEERRRDVVDGRVLAAERPDRRNRIARFLHLECRRVQQKRDARFREHLFEQNRIEDDRVALRVARQVLDEKLVQDAALARPAIVVGHVRRRAEHPEADLARRVASEHWPVLNERDFQPRARGGDGAADARHAASDHGKVTGYGNGLQFSAADGWLS